jgi:UDP-N-acetylmuramoyl-L-alanyl-D-glutamate--2,6-diaminopimelate ligase
MIIKLALLKQFSGGKMVVNVFTQSLKGLMAKFGFIAPDVQLQGLTLDSRLADKGTAFVAIKGHHQDGRDFIPAAINLGASLVLADTDVAKSHGQAKKLDKAWVIEFYQLKENLSALAAAFYDYPANKLNTIGVTGTNGKTSVVNLCSQIKHRLNAKVASIGTLGAGVYAPEQQEMWETPNGNTTPDAIRMQYLLAEFVQQKVIQVAFEASSHALVQGRLSKVKTDIAIFTNLSRDHLDYHGDMASYSAAKLRLLQQPGLRTIVLNQDDVISEDWRERVPQGVKVIWTSVSQCRPVSPQDRYCFATKVEYHQQGSQLRLETSWGTSVINTQLLGQFNVANMLSAAAAMLAQGENFDDLVNALEQLQPVRGRMEVFAFAKHANVVVDYAHTPDALAQALVALRQHTQGQLWCVFGCGGDRDKGKRPLMAQAAQENADVLMITTDNSRTESPQDIVADMKAGLQHAEGVYEEADREQAIRWCLGKAKANDIILLAGKGHEAYQIINNHKTNYNERAFVAQLQRELSQ